MKINIEVEASLDFDIKVTDEILDEVVRDYDGDFAEWAKDNYTDYFGMEDLDLSLDRVSFKKEEANELLKGSKEILGSSTEDMTRDAIDRTKLKHSIINMPVDADEFREFHVDAELLTKIVPFTDTNNPKIELNYIRLNGSFVEATETRMMVRYLEHKYVHPSTLFPTYFLEPIKNGGKVYETRSGKLLLNYKNAWYGGVDRDAQPKYKFKFPDVDGIIDKSEMEKLSWSNLNSVTMREVYLGGYDQIDLELNINGDLHYINKDYYENAMQFNIEKIATGGTRTNPNILYMIGDYVQVAIMPIVVSDSEIVEYIES